MNDTLKLIVRWLSAVILASWALFAPALAGLPVHAGPPAQSTVVFNETFDGAFANDPISQCTQGGCEVPQNWGVWFIPRRDTDPQGVNFQPKFGSINTAGRARAGSAQRIYENNKTFTGGIYRKIENAKVGSKIRLTVWGMIWSTNDESVISARPSTGIRLRIGIDPLGGNNGTPSPLSSQVVWSADQDVKDNFAQFTVETEVKSPTIIVYTYGTMKDIVRHNEVFWDDAVLEYVEEAPPTADPNATVDPNATAAPTAPATEAPPAGTGGVKHTVVAGDTLYGIALQYDVTVNDIKQLNNLTTDDLSIDQVLTIKPAQSAVPTATLEPTPAGSPIPPGPGTVAVVSIPISSSVPLTETGQACVTAYFDDNGNGLYDGSVEDFVPNIQFTLSNSSTVVASVTTDGVSNHCFENLPPVAYTVVATTSLAYVATTPMNDTLNVTSGAQSNFAVGLRNSGDGARDVTKTSTPTPSLLSSSGNVFGILATIGGSLLVLGAVGIVASLFLRRRQL